MELNSAALRSLATHIRKQSCRKLLGANINADFSHRIGLTWEGGDVIFEEALSFSRLCHESCEGSLYISSLTCCLLPQNLIVRHRFSESLEKHTSCNIPALWDFFLHGNEKQF